MHHSVLRKLPSKPHIAINMIQNTVSVILNLFIISCKVDNIGGTQKQFTDSNLVHHDILRKLELKPLIYDEYIICSKVDNIAIN